MRYAFPSYPEGMNGGGGGYPFPNPAAAAAAAAGLGVHSTTMDAHPAVSHSTPHPTPHSTLSESANHLPSKEAADIH